MSALPPVRGHQPVGAHARVGFVDRAHDDLDVWAEHFSALGICTQAIERRQRVRRNVRAHPRDRVAVVVVMSRLDQNELKLGLFGCRDHRGFSPTQKPAYRPTVSAASRHPSPPCARRARDASPSNPLSLYVAPIYVF
jgi:hypothetical protein